MNTETWDIYNESGQPTGRTTLRSRCALGPGEYHLVVHIWILSPDGRFLIQKRSADKKLMPGEWAATGGAAVAGEDPYSAAHRELFEELGIESDRQSLRKLTRIKRRNSLLDVFLIVTDIPVRSLVLQESEVALARWVSRRELDGMIRSGAFHNYGREYFNTVFDKIDSYRGAIV